MANNTSKEQTKLKGVAIMKKRILSLGLAFLMLYSMMSTSAFAAETHPVFEKSVAVTRLDPAHSSVAASHATVSSNKMLANYTYTFEITEDSPHQATVSVQTTLYVDNTAIPVQAKGIIRSYQIAEDDYLWEGPLDGYATYSGEACKVIVGFAKLDSSEEVQLTITFQDKDLVGISYVLGSVMTPDIEQAMFHYADEDEQPEVISRNAISPLSSTNSILPDDYDLISAKSAFYDSNNNDYSQYARLYFSEGSNLAILALTTYVEQLKDYYANYNNYVGYNHDPHIHSFTMSLTATDGAFGDESRRSYIVGMDASPNVINNSVSNMLLTTAFATAFEFLAIPGGTLFNAFIEDCIAGIRGDVSTSVSLYNAFLSVQFSSSQRTDFDGTNYLGFPMVVQLAVNNPSVYSGNSPYRYETSVRYRVPAVIGTVNPTLTYAYLDAQDISQPTVISLS